MTIGKRIAQLRKQRGWSQSELSSRAGWGRVQNRISNYEQDRSQPNYDALVTLARALECNPAWLAFGTPESRPVAVSGIGDVGKEYGGTFEWGEFGGPENDSLVQLTHVSDPSKGVLRIDKNVLEQANLDAEMARWDELTDNSMEPFSEHSKFVVNTEDVSVRSGRAYLIEQGGLRRVRLLYKLPNHETRLSAYNRSEWPDEVVSIDTFTILGRVCYWSVIAAG